MKGLVACGLVSLLLSGCMQAWTRGEGCAPIPDGPVGTDPRIPWPSLQAGDSYTETGWFLEDGLRFDLNRTTSFVGIENVNLRGGLVEAYRTQYDDLATADAFVRSEHTVEWSDYCGTLLRRTTLSANNPNEPMVDSLEADWADCYSDFALEVPLEVGQEWDLVCVVKAKSITYGDSWNEDWSARYSVVGFENVTVPAGTFAAYRIEADYKDGSLLSDSTAWFSYDACEIYIRIEQSQGLAELATLDCSQYVPKS